MRSLGSKARTGKLQDKSQKQFSDSLTRIDKTLLYLIIIVIDVVNSSIHYVVVVFDINYLDDELMQFSIDFLKILSDLFEYLKDIFYRQLVVSMVFRHTILFDL